jgi:hypothetical protein
MNTFFIAVLALAFVATPASITAMTPVFAQQDPNSHGLEVSGVAEGHDEVVSGPAHLAGRLPGGGCIVDESARLQGEEVSDIARDIEIGPTD